MNHLILSELALNMGLTACQAVALPTVMDRAALGQGMSVRALATIALESAKVRDYLASVCKEVA